MILVRRCYRSDCVAGAVEERVGQQLWTIARTNNVDRENILCISAQGAAAEISGTRQDRG